MALAPAALAAMAQNGIDQNTINSVQQKTKDGQQPSSQSFSSTAAIEVGAQAVSTITPSEAQSLMYRSMTTGVRNAEFDQYGGYSAVKAIFDANGGSYDLDAIPADQRKALAMQVASTGVGNMSAPVAEKIGVSSAVLQAMAGNGIDKATIEQIQKKTIGFEQAPFVDSNSYINIVMKASQTPLVVIEEENASLLGWTEVAIPFAEPVEAEPVITVQSDDQASSPSLEQVLQEVTATAFTQLDSATYLSSLFKA